MSDDLIKHIETLVAKAGGAQDKDDAMRFSQAALNAAHALQVLGAIRRETPK